jgi:hypothetical protein
MALHGLRHHVLKKTAPRVGRRVKQGGVERGSIDHSPLVEYISHALILI